MTFEDLRKFRDPDLILPINGKEYRIPQPSAKDGLAIKQLFAMNMLGSHTELEQIMAILGAHWEPKIETVHVLDPITGDPVPGDDGEPIVDEVDQGTWVGGLWDEMVADGVSWDEVMHAGRTSLIDVGLGRVVAETHWMTGSVPTLGDLPESEPFDDPENPFPKPEDSSGNHQPAAAPNRAARRANQKKSKKK